MNKRLKNLDFVLISSACLIVVFSLTTLFSIKPDFLFLHFNHLIVGAVLFSIFSILDYKIFKNFKIHLYFFCLAFLLLTLILGNITRGAIRWIRIFNLTLQPSELTKPFLILFLALQITNSETKPKDLILNLLLFAIPIFLIFIQPSFGNSVVLFIVWLGMILPLGISPLYLFLFLSLLAIMSPLFWNYLKGYQKQRILSFLNPQKDPLGAGYHLIQSTIAIGAGQLFGRGLGQGTQSHLKFLPERHTDFIFASFAEEFGFFGSAILLILYFILLLRIIIIAQKAEDNFGTLICLGVFSCLFGHLFINIGMNLGLLPVTGITLPLFSTGGSSLVSILICLGLVESVSRHQKRPETLEIK